jgi:hypothetical protein
MSFQPEVLIQDAVTRFVADFSTLREQAIRALQSGSRRDSVLTYFDFPDEIKVPCEQYLVYFVEFLRTLGVHATAELHHEVGRVLFAVTPIDQTEALDNIRHALSVYLRLPMAENLGATGITPGDFQTQQLVANVQHLKGQLALASAMLQLKDATIAQQQATIDQQRLYLSGEILPASEILSSGNAGDREDLLGGTVSLIPYEGKGFEVNLPAIYRKLKAIFAGNQPSDS